MSKRPRSMSPALRQASSAIPPPTKKTRHDAKFLPNKIATAEAAAKADGDPPLFKLLNALKKGVKHHAKGGGSVVYWMRMADLRSSFSSVLPQW